jgi:TolB-like protein
MKVHSAPVKPTPVIPDASFSHAVITSKLSARPSSDHLALAVLPFQNLSADPEQEFFSDGFTDELIAQVGRLEPGQLRVIARTSALHYKGTQKRSIRSAVNCRSITSSPGACCATRHACASPGSSFA